MTPPRLWHVRAVLDDGEVYEATIDAHDAVIALAKASRYARRAGRVIADARLREVEAAELPVAVEVEP